MTFLANVVIEPDLCNLRCSYCWIGETETVVRRGPTLVRRPRDASRAPTRKPIEELVRDLDALLGTIRAHVLKLSGGELLLIPEILEVASKAARRFGLVQILTNGTLIGERELGELDPSAFAFQLSLDGHTASSNTVRFGRRAERLTRTALDALDRLRFAGFEVEINCVLTPVNIGAFLPFVRYLAASHDGVTIFPFPARFTHGGHRLFADAHLGVLDEIVAASTEFPGTLPPRAYCEALRTAVQHGKQIQCRLPTFVQSSDEQGNLALCPCGNLGQLGNLYRDAGLIACPSGDDPRVRAILEWKHEKCRECFTHFDLLNLYLAGLVTDAELRRSGMFRHAPTFEAIRVVRNRLVEHDRPEMASAGRRD